jgi:Late competence development protein ComFB
MKTLINQTQAIVQMEISQVLEEYPHHPYQQVFANPDRRQDLTAYVLNHISSIYTSIDLEAAHRFSDDRDTSSAPTAFPTVVGLTIEAMVHRGINILLNQDVMNHEIPDVMDSGRMASSWFG